MPTHVQTERLQNTLLPIGSTLYPPPPRQRERQQKLQHACKALHTKSFRLHRYRVNSPLVARAVAVAVVVVDTSFTLSRVHSIGGGLLCRRQPPSAEYTVRACVRVCVCVCVLQKCTTMTNPATLCTVGWIGVGCGTVGWGGVGWGVGWGGVGLEHILRIKAAHVK